MHQGDRERSLADRDATRLTDWERTSPATKTPGMLDSSK